MNEINVTRELIRSWVNKIFDQITMISNIAFLLGMYLVMKYNLYIVWWQNYLMLAVYFIIIMATQSFDRWYKKQKSIGTLPTRKKRYTKNLDGAIVVKKSDMQEAIIYLSEIEDYLNK